jgi:cobalt-zinc-cadmium efflux system membrane fusion protein
VQDAKGVQLVFIPVAEDEYRARRVTTAPSDGDLIAVTDGLEAGESVVTTGSFLLKTETLKGSIGAGCCEVEKPK